MLQDLPRSLRHEYELYIEREIESYKNSVSRSVILSIGDEAVAALRAQEQLALDEMVLWDEVDRIIKKRLRLPAYRTWQRRRLKFLEQYRRLEHHDVGPIDELVRALSPIAEKHVLVAGERAQETTLYLAANGCNVTALDQQEEVLDRVMDAASAAGIAARVHAHVCDLGQWSPDLPLHAVICTPTAFEGLGPPERARVITLLQSATTDGGVHLVETIAAGQAAMSVEELTTRYLGWEISMDGRGGAAGTFLARKACA
jgi:hypothetical protein